MTIVKLTCQAPGCGYQWDYLTQQVQVRLYTHGVCAVSFACQKCKERSEFAVPDRIALRLDKEGAPTTVVHVPDEVTEWPAAAVPAINESDVGIMERSSHSHFEDCVRRELLDIPGHNARSEEAT